MNWPAGGLVTLCSVVSLCTARGQQLANVPPHQPVLLNGIEYSYSKNPDGKLVTSAVLGRVSNVLRRGESITSYFI